MNYSSSASRVDSCESPLLLRPTFYQQERFTNFNNEIKRIHSIIIKTSLQQEKVSKFAKTALQPSNLTFKGKYSPENPHLKAMIPSLLQNVTPVSSQMSFFKKNLSKTTIENPYINRRQSINMTKT